MLNTLFDEVSDGRHCARLGTDVYCHVDHGLCGQLDVVLDHFCDEERSIACMEFWEREMTTHGIMARIGSLGLLYHSGSRTRAG